MLISFDFESRSACDIKKHGAWVYSEHPTTDALMLAVRADGAGVGYWANTELTGLKGTLTKEQVFDMVRNADEIHAFNASFERAIWENVCHRRYGWPALPIHKLRCSMAQCAYHSLPMGLDAAAAALGLGGKDKDGYKLMLKLSKPRKVHADGSITWWGDEAMFARLADYCMQDVIAEHAISEALYPLPDSELAIWQLDQEINARGILADVASCRTAIGMIEADEARSLEQFKKLTHGSVSSPKQVTAFLKWLSSHGCVLPGLTKADVATGLGMDIRPEVREALQIRQKLGMSSVSKFQAILDRVSADGRLRGAFAYHGAGTGRWCMPGESEVLTPNGWVRMDEAAGDEIMCWEPRGNKLIFAPAVMRSFDYSGRMLHVESRFVSGMFTPEHKMPCITSRGYLDIQTAEYFGDARRDVPVSGVFTTGEKFAPEIETRILVMTQADGHVCANSSSGRLVRFRFKKQTKIIRAELLLSMGHIPYKKKTERDMSVSIRIKWADAPEYMKAAKAFNHDLLLHNPKTFIEELRHWDGHTDKRTAAGGFEYCTTNHDNAKWAATMAHLAGWAASITEKPRIEEIWNTAYRVFIRNKSKARVADATRWEQFSGKVYCPETMTGFFLVRYNGKIHITGNSGRGVQLQNLPRKSYHPADIAALEAGDVGWFDMTEDNVPAGMSKLIRGMFMAGPGNELAVADYSSIEARVVAWLAGEEKVLTAFREKLDLYKVAATAIYGVRYENVTKDQRQVGKCAVLALGYQGGVGAFQSMATVYGVRVPDEQAQDIVTKWRGGHQAIVQFWADLEKAAVKAVETGRVQTVGRIKFGIKGQWLCMKLPSGRSIHYPFPKLEERPTKWGTVKRSVTFMNGSMGRWFRDHTYGGKLCENCFTAYTKVITTRGVLPIVEVLPGDLVWDGGAWVKTQGPICRGNKEVVSWLGVQVTSDHLITDGSSWKSVMDSDAPFLLRALWWAQSSINSPSFLRTPESTEWRLAGAHAETLRKSLSEISGEERLRGVRRAVMQRLGLKGQHSSGTLKLSATQRSSLYGGIDILEWFRVVLTHLTKPIQTTGAVESQSPCAGSTTEETSSDTQKLFPGGTNSALILTELTTMGTTAQETSDLLNGKSIPETKDQTPSSPTSEKGCLCQSSGKGIAPGGEVTTQSSTTSTWEDQQKKSSLSITEAGVYDLLNCGPEHRFTILTDAGPLVVHNCVQGGARDLLADALLRVEAAGMPVVLHVHDEAGAEVPRGHVDLAEFEALMAAAPEWADGCPIGAEGWIGTRYRK